MSRKMEASDRIALENRPGIFFIGSSNVGKRTLLSRLLLLPRDFDDASDSSSQLLAYGWTINTKYYTADVSVWMAHLHDEFSIRTLPIYDRLAALVMVFDMSDLSSLVAVQEWASRTDIHEFEILLCIGNKADLVPDHPVHSEYRRRLLKLEESSSVDPYAELYEFGISETEGSSLLGDENPAGDIKRSCLEWCTEHNIEYIEACASNADFDKCLSINGDLQGVERLWGALSAHMWPGMILTSGKSIAQPALPNAEDSSEEESDYELDYEVLSAGSAEPWDDTYGGWVSANDTNTVSDKEASVDQNNHITNYNHEKWVKFDNDESLPSTSVVDNRQVVPHVDDSNKGTETNKITPFDFEDLEQLMSQIGNMRDNLRLMPDFQRREMAAELAMKMASMFGGGSDDEGEFD